MVGAEGVPVLSHLTSHVLYLLFLLCQVQTARMDVLDAVKKHGRDAVMLRQCCTSLWVHQAVNRSKQTGKK